VRDKLLRLRAGELLAAAAEQWGAGIQQRRIAEHLRTNQSLLSLYINDIRQPSVEFVGRVLDTLPGGFDRYFEYRDPDDDDTDGKTIPKARARARS
jgi:transcriptional regulator with XRE-family HTH domain